MVDGLVQVEFDTEGNGRVRMREWNDAIEYLDNTYSHFDMSTDELYEQLKPQLPTGITDSLVMVLFRCEAVPVGQSESFDAEYDIDCTVEKTIVLRENYKEHYRSMLTNEFEETYIPYDPTISRHREAVMNWENLYNEDFTPTKNPEVEPPHFWNYQVDRQSSGKRSGSS